MIESEADKKWRELQDKIENLFGHLLKGGDKKDEQNKAPESEESKPESEKHSPHN